MDKPRCHECGSEEIIGAVRDCIVRYPMDGTVRREPLEDGVRHYCELHPTESIEHKVRR